jgi:uncharacterized protein (DUF1778 family)
MAEWLPIQIKAPAETKKLLERAAQAIGLTLSAFMRQAAVEKANKVLGLRPTLPLHVASKDRTN